ncbi:MAG: S8 family serine peptidase [Thermoplasmatota archaeon]
MVGPSAALAAEPNVLVSYTGEAPLGLVAANGGSVVGQDSALHLLAIVAVDPGAFIHSLSGTPGVTAQPNGAVRASDTVFDSTDFQSVSMASTSSSSTTWDSTTWDSTTWDNTTAATTQSSSTTWDSTTWDSTTWDSTTWDSTTWDSTTWDSTTWDATTTASTTWDSTTWDSTTWDSTTWDSSLWNGAVASGKLWDLNGIARAGNNGHIDPLLPYQWGYFASGGPGVNQLVPSSNKSIVCVLDTGVDYRRPEISADLWHAPDGTVGWNFVANNSLPMDDAGHGTHVAGIISAVAGNTLGGRGLSQELIMAVKVLNETGSGTELNLAYGIQWCVDHGANVVSMSLTTPIDSAAVHSAVDYAISKNVVVVAAAGNNGAVCNCVNYPAAYPEVIGVGAVMPNGSVAPFSAGGPNVKITAPGWGIVSLLPNGGYAALNGTSQATPFVAATAAMIHQIRPTLTPGEIYYYIARSARHPAADQVAMSPTYGHGVLNAESAIKAVLKASGK